ncbi:hypothetical protein BCR35DRAFT_350484 [Leucosporidium creatinivorum]|uniref:Kinetochore protein SPC25 n=1 Tax=Leucosporidium creatinivorum TaxID=106004 RepID=A0A1Y2FZI5_9BASI|nr:hypothetical protein BCR35DRAFT_350484 [Leucosporidium creatinivorum]
MSLTMFNSPSSTTTPRTSRRLTVNPTTPSRLPISLPPSLPPLAPLNLRSYPSTPYAQDPLFQSKLTQDRSNIDYTVQSLDNSLSLKRKDVQQSLAELDEEKRRIQAATKNLGEQAKEMMEKVGRELEQHKEAKGKKVEVEQQGRVLEQQMESIAAEIKEEQKKLLARRELKARQREAFQKQANKNGPELAFFEEKLGLKIRGIGKDTVQFRFSNVDSRNYQRSFSFNVDASKPLYSVTLASPSPTYLPPTTLQPLLTYLNRTRDLYGFARRMREAFKDEVGLEKMGIVGEGEKERERERVRAERERR